MNRSLLTKCDIRPILKLCGLTLTMALLSLSMVQAQGQLACNDHIQVSLDENCLFSVNLDVLLEAPPVDTTCLIIEIYDDNGNLVPNNQFNSLHRGRLFDYVVRDTCVINSCWGQISVEDKLAPQFVCMQFDTVWCSQTSYFLDQQADQVFEACGTFQRVIVDDVSVDFPCDSACAGMRWITYYYVDDSGNESDVCIREICYRRATLEDVVMPEDTIFTCSNYRDSDPRRTGVPQIDGFPIYPESHFCEINCTYEDQVIDICPQSFKILRKWTCYDWCQPTSSTNPQIDWQVIKVLDEDPPIVYCPTTEEYRDTIGTDVWSCTGTTILPEPHILEPNRPITDSFAVYIISECSEVTYSVRHIPAINPQDCTPERAVPSTKNVRYDNALDRWVAFDLPLGCNWFYYTFTDECGNQTECSFDIYVEDDVPPVPICDEHTTVTLNDVGLAKVWAATFDDGSVDNCNIDSMDVRRMTVGCDSASLEYGPYVLFCCEDLGKTIMVEFRVWDEAGNSNTCMVEVNVNDKVAPKMILPPNITVDCRFDFDPNDLSVFGRVVDADSLREPIFIQDSFYSPDFFVGFDGWAWDNCGELTIDEEVDFNLVCGVGTIRRTFTATDPGGLFITRTQVITITDNDRFGYDDIEWPQNVTIYGCLNIDTDTSQTGSPQFENVHCANPTVTWDDHIFTQVQDACYKVERTWTVVDWCAFDLGYKDWQWTWKQIIKVTDTVAPVFLSCEDLLFCDDSAYISRGRCVGNVLISPDVMDECTQYEDLDIRYRIDQFQSGTFGPWIVGDTVEGDYPVGEHSIQWEVSDGCGNVNRCTQDFEVKDCKAPTPYCRTGIITVLMEGPGEITIWASDFNIGSFDNCTDTSDLKFSFSADTTDKYITYNCDSLAGELTITRTIRMYVTDECGNQDYCETTVEIQENDRCIGSSTANISGLVTDERNAPVVGVEVQLVSPHNNDILKTTTTDDEGRYDLNVVKGDAYIIRPFYDEDDLNGVSTRDITFIQRELLGKELLGSAYKRVAADANYSQSISAGDISEIRKLILGRYAAFPKNNSWRFVRADHVMADEYQPWGAPEEIAFPFIDADQSDIDFIGIKTGDVDNSADLDGLDNNSTRFEDICELSYEVTELNGPRYQIDILREEGQELSGLQLTLDFDEAVKLFNVQSGYMEVKRGNFSDHDAEEGLITLSWSETDGVNEDEDNILFSVIIGSGLGSFLEVDATSEITRAEAYNEFDEVMQVVMGKKEVEEGNGFVLNQNVPNPFTGMTTISFELPNPQNFTMTFYDPSGRVVKKIDGYGNSGENTITVSESDFSSQVGNIIFYQLDTEDQSATKKLIMMK